MKAKKLAGFQIWISVPLMPISQLVLTDASENQTYDAHQHTLWSTLF